MDSKQLVDIKFGRELSRKLICEKVKPKVVHRLDGFMHWNVANQTSVDIDIRMFMLDDFNKITY